LIFTLGYVLQAYVWNGEERPYFIACYLFFPILFGAYFRYRDKGRDMIVFESILQGEIMEYPDGSTYTIPSTGQNLWEMSEGYYRRLKHVGDLRPWFWDFLGIVHCDYFDQENGILFHPEDPRLHNVMFVVAKSMWLSLKEKFPKIIIENQRLKIARDAEVAIALDNMKPDALAEWSGLQRVSAVEDVLEIERGARGHAYHANEEEEREESRHLKLKPPGRLKRWLDG